MREYTIKGQLYVDIYTIGYEPKGEGIVLKIKDGNKTVFCCVIDCYEIENQNETLKLIQDESIDLICLTHPHEDHCKGIEKILEKANSSTTILYPNYMLDEKYRNKKDANNTIEKISKILIKRRDNNSKPRTMACVGRQCIMDDIKFFDIENGGKYGMYVNTYTPLSVVLDKRKAKEFLGENTIGDIQDNNLSIMMSITIGRLKLLFCGDTEDETITELNDVVNKEEGHFFNGVIDYVKIPHHGSDGTLEMFNLLSNVNTVSNSVSTVYRISKIPKIKVLEEYRKKRSKVYCTGHIDKDENISNYGIVKQRFDIINETVKSELIKNAVEI